MDGVCPCVCNRGYKPTEDVQISPIEDRLKGHKLLEADYKDNPKQMAYVKLGREINKFKERDKCYDPKIIDQRFGKEAAEIGKPKKNTELLKAMTHDYIEGLKRAYKKV